MKNKHLSLEDRHKIENGLNDRLSFKEIGKLIDKDCTSISREVRNHYIVKNTGCFGKGFNNCSKVRTCVLRGKQCKLNNCVDFVEEKCSLLDKPPYVCNGCKKRNICTLSKHFYDSIYAHSEYKDNLSETRSGVIIDKEETDNLNSILVPLIRDKGQSIHQAIINNKNKIMYSEKTIYKIDKDCLENRRYEDYKKFIEENPDTPIVEIDTVIGKKGGKVLLTVHFVNCSFMLAFIREHNDAQSVIDIFNDLQEKLGIEKFKELFIVILTDNGSEFSNPTEIEFDMKTGEKRTQIFYCHPSSPYEKGSCEVNHELLRRILPKGTSFDNLSQEDINLVMSHINSYKRKKLNNKSPYFMFSSIYGKDTIDKLGIIEIEPNEVNLSNNLIKK